MLFSSFSNDFGRGSHVYNQLIRLCINMSPHVVISRLRNWKRIFVKKEDFLMLAEKYITENGSEALDELIASKANAASRCLKTKREHLVLKSCGEPQKMINATSNSLEQKITKVEQKNVENMKVQKYCYRPKRSTIEQKNMSTSVQHQKLK